MVLKLLESNIPEDRVVAAELLDPGEARRNKQKEETYGYKYRIKITHEKVIAQYQEPRSHKWLEYIVYSASPSCKEDSIERAKRDIQNYKFGVREKRGRIPPYYINL